MLSPAEATREILSTVSALPVQEVPLLNALGRVLAADIESRVDLPHLDNSAMDGYAVRSTDVRGKCPVELRIIERVPAGVLPDERVGPGECTRVFTGAPTPDGADGIIRQEDTTPLADGRVRIDDDRDAGQHVRRKGEDIQRGTVAVAKGTELGPAHIGVLASIAQSNVPVHRTPRVAVMASGDEIADLDEVDAIIEGEKIGSSNTYTLHSMVRLAGGEPVVLGIAKDDLQDLRERILSAPKVDLLVTSGGVSVGEHDYLRPAFEQLGAEIKFWRIRMQPGKPVAFGILRGTPWIGLPGNPVSTMVTFEVFVRPAIRVMLGHSCPFRRTVPVRLGESITINSSRYQFLRAVVDRVGQELTATITGPQGSGILTSMAKANALLAIPGGAKQLAAGEAVQAILLDETVHVRDVPF